jgi:cyclopropane fatty-acyl-phospholipid synthase-like methyltransferase
VQNRLTRAVAALSVRPGDTILEVGCGNGGAVTLVCERLDGGKILAIDRSVPMITLAKQRNAANIASGKAAFRAIDLVALSVSDRFDKIFAVNVNTFWRRPVPRELALIKKLLRPKGVLHLFFESPEPRAQELARRVVAALEPSGLKTTVKHEDGILLNVKAQIA